jgi:hypothetical protein
MAVVLLRALLGDRCERTYTYAPVAPNDAAGLSVTLRPLPGDKADEYLSGDTKTATARAADIFAKTAVGWNVADGADPAKAAALSAANFLALPYPAQQWLINCMVGYGLADKTDPKTGEKTTEQAQAEKN